MTTDWRKLPRKPPEQKQSQQLSIRVTAAERAEIAARAKAARLTIRDYVVGRCVGP